MAAKIQIFLFVVLAVICALCGVYYVGNKAGKKAVELKQKTAAVKAMKRANNVENAIRAMPDDDVNKRLLGQWSK